MPTAIQRIAPNAVIIALGIAATVVGSNYGVLGNDGRIGPGFLPTVSGALMAIFALSNVMTSGKKPGTTLEGVVEQRIPGIGHSEALVEGNSEGDLDIYGRTQSQRDKMLWIVIAVVLATVILVPLLGFMLAFAVMLVVVAVVVERRKILPSLIVTAVALATTYAIFVMFLRVPLPRGILGI